MQLDPQIFASQLESEKQKAELDVLERRLTIAA